MYGTPELPDATFTTVLPGQKAYCPPPAFTCFTPEEHRRSAGWLHQEIGFALLCTEYYLCVCLTVGLPV